jgi:hypothetical protein
VPRSVGVAEVHLAVDEYPRAMVYRVRTDREGEVVEASRNLCEVRIVPPKQTVLAVPMKEDLRVDLQVDAPYDAFVDPQDVVQVWLSRADNSDPIGGDRKPFYSDRAVRMTLEDVSPEGPIKVSAQVRDLQAAFDLGDLQDKIKVRAKLDLHKPARGDEDAIDLILDGDPPKVELTAPGELEKGGDLVVSAVVADRLSGPKKVEFGFDLDDSGHLEDKEVLAKREAPNLNQPVRIATKELKLNVDQQYAFFAKATDYAGHVTETSQPIMVRAPAGEAGKAMGDKVPGTIKGTVTSELGTCRSVTVEAEGLPAPEMSGADFVFKEVPPGKYTIRAKGRAGPSTAERTGLRTVTVKGGETVTADVKIE